MKPQKNTFDAEAVLHDLKHYLPAQAPLKDFIHHNTLHAFQTLPFYKGIHSASQIFGYRVSLSLDEYRALYAENRIDATVLAQVIERRKGADAVMSWRGKLRHKTYESAALPRIGSLRAFWKKQYHVDLDSLVHPLLFRILCSYLDQGISIWSFPVGAPSFLSALRELERTSYSSFFRTARARQLLLEENTSLTDLLRMVVGNEGSFKQYLFDQQFAHQGWSGLVSSVEDQPQALLDQKPISLHDLVMFELMLEIDALDDQFGKNWAPLCAHASDKPGDLLRPVTETELDEVLSLWQDAFEWTYYDQVLAGIRQGPPQPESVPAKSFQAMFCIDDRECSLRRHLEHLDSNSETFGTPGFFGVETYFQPEGGTY
ncbi:MAG TPA: putative inorganic carbon transporter subunit DabA, partial [Fibrella sp.]